MNGLLATESPTDVLLRGARLAPGAEPVDVLVAGGKIGSGDPSGPVEAIELDGRFLLPGLWDHHVHFDQWTLTSRRLDLAGTASAAAVVARVAHRVPLEPPSELPLVGYGFRDALWTDEPHFASLDAVTGARPAVMVSGDLHSAWLNSAALARFGLTGHPSGLLREDAAMAIFDSLRQVPTEVLDGWAATAATDAAARGVVGIVDLEAPFSLDAWVRRAASAPLPLRVACGVWTSALDEAIARGLRTGDVVSGLIEMGPFKVITDGSLNTRTAFCHDPYPGTDPESFGLLVVPPAELEPLLARASSAGFACAVHAIGDHANTLALDAFAATGARGSIEHAQLLAPADVARFAALGVVASVQPEHAMDDRDVAEHHWAGRTGRSFVLRSLLDAGATLALGSDAPVAPLDPWLAISAAVHRTRPDREPWHPEQAITVTEALAASSRGPVVAGAAADLIVVDDDPFTADAATLRAMPVTATLVAGRFTHRAGV